MRPSALVAYGSKNGSTAEIARWIASVLRDNGIDADARSAHEIQDVGPYDAVVLGGALYAGRWHRDARRFARRHHRELAARPVWLFSSGPLDPSASERDIPPVAGPVGRPTGWMRRNMSRSAGGSRKERAAGSPG